MGLILSLSDRRAFAVRGTCWLAGFCALLFGSAVVTHADWQPVEVPAAWEPQNAALSGYDGFAWYRAYVRVPAEWAGSRMLLIAGSIDNVDEAFFNGQRIGANGSMPPLYGNPSSNFRRPFVVDPDLVRFGEFNLIAWRVYDKGGRGGIVEGPVHLSRKDDAIDLAGRWLFRTGDIIS